MPLFTIGFLVGVLLLGVMLWRLRPMVQAQAEEEETNERLLAVFQNPRASSEADLDHARSFGYESIVDSYGALEAKAVQILHADDLTLLGIDWYPHGLQLRLHESPVHDAEGLYLQVWDDNGVTNRPITIDASGTLRRVTALWHGAAWIDFAALLTEHRIDNGILCMVRGISDDRHVFSLRTQLPVSIASEQTKIDVPATNLRDPLLSFVHWLQRTLHASVLPQVFGELGQIFGDPSRIARLASTEISPTETAHIPSETLLLEGALRTEMYALADVLALVAAYQEHIVADQQESTRRIFSAFHAEAMWRSTTPSSAAQDWRRQEAGRLLGLPARFRDEDARRIVLQQLQFCHDDELLLEETGLDDLAALRRNRIEAAAVQIFGAEATQAIAAQIRRDPCA